MLDILFKEYCDICQTNYYINAFLSVLKQHNLLLNESERSKRFHCLGNDTNILSLINQGDRGFSVHLGFRIAISKK